MSNKIGFLLGAGITPKDFPKTDTLTNVIQNKYDQLYVDRNVHYSNKGETWPAKESIPIQKRWPSVIRLKKKIFKLLNKNSNYEDVYFIAQEIYDHISGERPNPLLNNCIECLVKDMDVSEDEIEKLANDLCHFIEDVVYSQLNVKADISCYFDNFFPQLCKDNKVTIFSLNHDLLLEQYFTKNKITYEDGFYNGQFDMERFSTENDAIKLLKLHGSIDWDEKTNGKQPVTFIKLANGRQPASGRRTGMIIGTYNKFQSYATPVFLDLLSAFGRQLKTLDALIISGYGLRDHGINTLLLANVFIPETKCIIIHPEPEECLENSLGAIKKREIPINSVFIKKEIQELRFNDIEEKLINE